MNDVLIGRQIIEAGITEAGDGTRNPYLKLDDGRVLYLDEIETDLIEVEE